MCKKVLYCGWVLSSILLLLYSFTQIDLNLTFSRVSIWQKIQASFQYIGYFQRPLSTYLFLFIVVSLFMLYLLTLYAIKKGEFKRREIWQIILIISGILLFSYNAFSYDLFNYLFDARIVTFYHQNPYEHAPQDFVGDPMLNFMRSVHRIYPYGPVWLGLTIPLSFLGSGVALFTFYLFKLLMVGSFLGTAYFLERMLRDQKVRYSLEGLAFFALNPLVLIEVLVSAHNDSVMVFFGIFALFLLISKKYVRSFLSLVFSIGIKFTTVFLLPVFVIVIIAQLLGRKIQFKKMAIGTTSFMLLSVIAMSLAGGSKTPEPQPWYLLNLIPFVVLLSKKRLVTILTVCVSFGMLLFYVPFLYSGEWPKNIVELKLWLMFSSLILGLLIYFISLKIKSSSSILS